MNGLTQPDGGGPRYFGLYPALVTDLVDPRGLGRIQVRFPWLGTAGEADVRAWGTLLTPYADHNQGLQILPEVDSQVVVGFEAGDIRRPYLVGCCWNGQASLPETPEAANNKRLIRTREGSVLEFDDTAGAAKVTLSLQSGHRLVLDDGSSEVTLSHSSGAQVVIRSSGAVEINANSKVDVNAPLMNVHAATANFDGTINCMTLIASASVVSPSYTPGAGNVW